MNTQNIKDIGYLVLRLGLGTIMAIHGWPKISGGTSMWTDIGQTMSVFGITFMPAAWGFCAAAAEFFGGICVALGILHRPACALVVFTMLIAFLSNFGGEHTFNNWNHPAELAIAFFAMFLIGPGRFSLSVSLNK